MACVDAVCIGRGKTPPARLSGRRARGRPACPAAGYAATPSSDSDRHAFLKVHADAVRLCQSEACWKLLRRMLVLSGAGLLGERMRPPACSMGIWMYAFWKMTEVI